MKTRIVGLVVASILLFIGATDWDGVASVVSTGDLPGGGHSIATNAFPKGTVVDVTNLENYKTTRVIVVSGLSNSGILATLSRSTAAALEISGDSVSRIRMTQPSDEIAFSYLRQQGIIAPDDKTPEETPDVFSVEKALAEAEDAFPVEKATAEAEAEHALAELNIVSSDERIPESDEHVIASEHLVPPIDPSGRVAQENDYRFIDAIQGEGTVATEDGEPSVDFSPFQAPLISRLERNKWYIQVAAYTRPDFVEEEISRMGSDYPLAIQNVGTDTNPLFRVLLGPLNQGESAAMLRRVKSIGYKDAFAKRG